MGKNAVVTLVRRLGPPAILLLFATTAFAGGIGLYEIGTPDLGTASAGRAAYANDASTAFGNPAGMSRLERSEILVGIQPIVVTTEFDTGAGTTVAGTDGGNAGGFVPSAGLYYVYSWSDDLKFGASLNSYAGGVLDYDDDWVGRYYTTEVKYLTFNLNPVLSYRVLPWLSLGAGFSIQYAQMEQEAAINNRLESLPDGELKYNDWNIGWGGNFGALVELDAETRFGVTYRSAVSQHFRDVPTFAGIGPGYKEILERNGVLGNAITMDIDTPQEVMVSAYRQMNEDLALMANFGWQNWAQFGEVAVSLVSADPRSATVNSNYENTFHGALGMHYRLAKPAILQLGFAYDSSAVSKPNRLPNFPADRQLRFALGVQYEINEEYVIGAAYEIAGLGGAGIDATRGPLSGTLQGDYSTNMLNVFGFTVIHRF